MKIKQPTQHRTAKRSSRIGGWLPSDHRHLAVWINRTRTKALERAATWHPVIREFKAMIDSDPVIFMYFTRMFEEQPNIPIDLSSGDRKLNNYNEMLNVLNHVISSAPTFDETGMVGFPINAILDYPMITPAGISAFANHKVNEMIRRVLNVWAEFLSSPDSRTVLNESPTGWLCPEARAALKLDDYQTKPSEPYWGFASWNDFFIRGFKPGLRPVAQPSNDNAIVCVCESQAFAIQTGVKKTDEFWLKAQPYSLRELLNGNFVDHFVGGTVYQAYLDAKNYHRWHSPVTGVIRRIRKVPGTYYAEANSEGFDPLGPNYSQGYIAHVATRALIFIEADNPNIGLMCFVAVGMAEVSSCVMIKENRDALTEGQRVRKGDQIGYFQFGGSTHCLVFRAGVVSRFVLEAQPQGEHSERSPVMKVNSLLAMVE